MLVYNLKQPEESVLNMPRWIANKRYYQLKQLKDEAEKK
jgi:hypothetical protein